MVDFLFKPEDKVKSKEEKKHCKEKLFIAYFKQLLYEDADAVLCIKFIIFLKKVFILVVLSLCCCKRAFSGCGEQRAALHAVEHGLLIEVAPIVVEHRL